MTRKLYWEDAYTKEFDAGVVKSAGNDVVLDQTAFYPTGGGQQNDTGKLVANGKEFKVIDVRKEGEEVIHVLESNEFPVGAAVRGLIDWDRRYALMKHHTAVHILGAIVANKYNGNATGGQIYENKAHIDFDCPQLNKELAGTIVEECSRVAMEGHSVNSRFISREEALNTPELVRTEPGRELIKGLSMVRVVEIVGFDIQTDGGTHVMNTKEIGKISLGGFDNKGSKRKRIEIVLG